MGLKKKITVSWSGGKDSAFALYKTLASGEFDVVSLHTLINQETARVGMHGVRETLMDKQASGLGIPLQKIYLEASADHAAYGKLMKSFYKKCAAEGISHVLFGDIFLEDLKRYRETLLHAAGLQGEYPLWGLDTTAMLDDFLNTGFKTLLCTANANFFTAAQMGKTLDLDFARSLPAGVDPCGENGEFHTFVYDGPIFKKAIAIATGEVVQKTYAYKKENPDGTSTDLNASFWFQDLLPV